MKTKLLKSIFILFSILPFFGFTFCFGQTQTIIKKINQSYGLSNDRINKIVKEKNGFVWIATKNGLNRYDGNKVKIYNKQNSALSSNDISDLLIDKNGRIWIATFGGGLNLYNPLDDSFVTYKNILNKSTSIPTNELNTVFEDSDGTIWLGTKNGISRFNQKEQNFKTFRFDSKNVTSISHNDVRSIYEDEDKNLWIGTFGGGLNKFNPTTGKFYRIKSTANVTADYIYAVCGISKDQILLGTNGNGLVAFDVNSLSFHKQTLGINTKINIVLCIKKTKDGTIWFGTDGFGLFKISNVNSSKSSIYNYTNEYKSESSISGNAIYSLMEDEHSNIWVGTAWNGVDVLGLTNDYTLLPSYSRGSTPISVLSVYKNKDAFFMGLDGKGLAQCRESTNLINGYSDATKNAFGNDYIQYISEAKNGTLWIGTFVNGLINYNYKTGVFKQFKPVAGNPKSLSYNDVRYVIEDEKSNIWIATWGGGLNYFNVSTKEFSSFKHKKESTTSISSDNVISLQKDGTSIWMATFGGGLNLLDTKTNRFTSFKSIEGDTKTPSSDYLYSILKDSRGNIWIGTAGEGINLLRKSTKKIDRFDYEKDVRYQTVTAIIEDNKGLIWFSTKQGIFNYDYATNRFKNFSNLKEDYHINSCFKDDKGILYFGCSKGVVKFNPQSIKVKNVTPKVKFTGFKLFNKEVPIGEDQILKKDISYSETITLKHDENVITFEFAALLFPSSANCEYQIQMENFDENWRTIGKEGSATYTNLSPGNYLFKVRSRELGSQWSKEYSSLNIEILKPFWREWWAFLIYVLLIIVALYFFIKYIVLWEKMKADLRFEKFTHEKDVELYNLKQDFFTNISHEIRTPVTLILGSINKLLKNNTYSNENQTNPLNTIIKNGEYLLNLVNELLDYRKMEGNQIKLTVVQQDWVKFSKEIFLSFKELAYQKEIKFEFETSSERIDLWFDKNQMEKVFYNLFSNAFKFTRAGGSIKLTISETETEAQLQLTDEGIGIPKTHLSKIFNRFYQANNHNSTSGVGFGLGLTISKEIIKLHQGEITVKSKEGSGSTFTIILKKGNLFYNELEIDRTETNEELIENYFSPNQSKGKLDDKDTNSEVHKEQTLLIVEDNVDICNYIAELFSDEYFILKAHNGAEGLEIAFEKAPDIIISDVMMPIMDGIELTHYLKSNVKTSHIPIILLTARASLMHKMQGFETGADDYVTKPFNESLLRARIKNILKNRSLLHEKIYSEDTNDIVDFLKNKNDQEFIENLGLLIEKNIDSDNLSAVYVAQELGMSHSVLYKKLKVITGLSLLEYMRDYRLKKAKRLLETKQYSINEVCFQVGYSDRKYFSRLFKERFGYPPSFHAKQK